LAPKSKSEVTTATPSSNHAFRDKHYNSNLSMAAPYHYRSPTRQRSREWTLSAKAAAIL
jgi:hypothetical protein